MNEQLDAVAHVVDKQACQHSRDGGVDAERQGDVMFAVEGNFLQKFEFVTVL